MKILELFAGYGSQALALENLGIEFTSDISKQTEEEIELICWGFKIEEQTDEPQS